MALNWTTYRAIPRLTNYTEAKEWHDDTLPIRGDANKTRPAGRRDQKWFSIWEHKNAIHVGYGGREPEHRKELVTFEKSGAIVVNPYQYQGASTNERLSKLLGTTFKTYQYDTWVNCLYYENGKLTTGWLPVPRDRPARFVREGDALVFVNYSYPVTHKVSREKMKAKLGEYAEFIKYMRGVWKLADGRPSFTTETRAEAFGTSFNEWIKRQEANRPPQLRWGGDVQQNRQQFFEWAASSDPMDHLRAAITLNNVSYNQSPVESFKEYVVRTYKEGVLDKVEHREGKLVKDRMKLWLMG